MDYLSPPEYYKTTPPPAFGRPMRDLFSFDPEYVNLNHGSYGSLPNPVSEAVTALSKLSEANPDLFHRFTYIPLLVSVREQLARFIGAEHTDEVVMVPNASHGINTVLRNFVWEEGDVVVSCTTTYGSVSRTAQYISDTPPHPRHSVFEITFPTTHTEILGNWRAHLRALNVARSQANTSNSASSKKPKIVAIVDAIISNPGAYLPWEEMVKICKEENVWSVVDAAHSIGQEEGLDMAKAKPDFWVSNCHKWLFAKRGCALLYVPKRNQHIIKTTFPTSHTYLSPREREPQRDEDGGEKNFVAMFEWNGTIDFTTYLSVASALSFRSWIGGERAINEYCHCIALEGGKKLAEVLGGGSEVMGEEFTLSMVNVSVPLPPALPPRYNVDPHLRRKLLIERKMWGAFYFHGGRWWVRCSAQIWSEVEDFEKLGKGILVALGEIESEFLAAGEGEKAKAKEAKEEEGK